MSDVLFIFEVSPATIDYTEIIKAGAVLLGGIVTGVFGVVGIIFTVFGGAISEAWKERKKAKLTTLKQTAFSDRLFIYNAIFFQGIALVNNPNNNIDRLLFIRTINGTEFPKHVNVFFAYSPTNKYNNLADRYSKVPINNDSQYQGAIRQMQNGEILWLTTLQLPDGILKRLYSAEGIIESRWEQVDQVIIDKKRTEVWFITMGTFANFSNNDKLEMDLFVQFAKLKTGYTN